jgi:hypothetical protein
MESISPRRSIVEVADLGGRISAVAERDANGRMVGASLEAFLPDDLPAETRKGIDDAIKAHQDELWEVAKTHPGIFEPLIGGKWRELA